MKGKGLVVLSVALAIVALSATLVLANHDFPDVPNSAFYHNDVSWLVDQGITAGCGGGKYCPNDPVTRGQMAVFLHKFAPIKTLVTASGTESDATITTTYEELDTIGNFNKVREGTEIKITWTDNVATIGGTEGTHFCDFQVRVDGAAPPSSTGRAVNYGGYQAVTVVTVFDGLAPGAHEITIWVRGNTPGSCLVNNVNFTQTALVEEIAYF